MGNGATLVNSGSIWKKLVTDAKERGCFYNAEDDKSLSKAIVDALVNVNSLLFRNARWKVCILNTTVYFLPMGAWKVGRIVFYFSLLPTSVKFGFEASKFVSLCLDFQPRTIFQS